MCFLLCCILITLYAPVVENQAFGITGWVDRNNDVGQRVSQALENPGVPYPGYRQMCVFETVPATNDILLFGGLQEGGPLWLSDTWLFHVNASEWEKLSPGLSPSARYAVVSAPIPTRRIVVFGGTPSNTDTPWVFSWDVENWIPSTVNSGSPPSERTNQVVWPMKEPGDIGIYTACGEIAGAGQLCDPIYEFRLSSETTVDGDWISHPTPGPRPPSPRHSSKTWVNYARSNSQLWLFGGEEGGGYYYSLHYVDIDKNYKWVFVTDNTMKSKATFYYDEDDENDYPHPGSRYAQASGRACDDLFIMFGGIGYGAEGDGTGQLGDLWIFNMGNFVRETNAGWTFVKLDDRDDNFPGSNTAPDYAIPHIGPAQRYFAGGTFVSGNGTFFLHAGRYHDHPDLWSFFLSCTCFGNGLECSGHGTCNPDGDSCTCDDHSRYTGPSCSVPVCFGETDASGACSGLNGDCVGADECLCMPHWRGSPTCDVYVEEVVCDMISSNESVACLSHGVCTGDRSDSSADGCPADCGGTGWVDSRDPDCMRPFSGGLDFQCSRYCVPFNPYITPNWLTHDPGWVSDIARFKTPPSDAPVILDGISAAFSSVSLAGGVARCALFDYLSPENKHVSLTGIADGKNGSSLFTFEVPAGGGIIEPSNFVATVLKANTSYRMVCASTGSADLEWEKTGPPLTNYFSDCSVLPDPTCLTLLENGNWTSFMDVVIGNTPDGTQRVSFHMRSIACRGLDNTTFYPALHPWACGLNGKCLSEDFCDCQIFNVSGARCPTCDGVDGRQGCRNHGWCIAAETCVCDDPSQYDGPYCQWPVCDGIIGSNFSTVCNGTAESCVEPDVCDLYCFGKRGVSEGCNFNGSCVELDTCDCFDESRYTGVSCSVPVCAGVRADVVPSCGGPTGTCEGPDSCSAYCGSQGPGPQSECVGEWMERNIDVAQRTHTGADANTDVPFPGVRSSHVFELIPNTGGVILMFEYQGNTWLFHPTRGQGTIFSNTWESLGVLSPSPLARHSAGSAGLHAKAVALYAGYYMSGYPVLYDDPWLFSLESRQWTQATVGPGDTPTDSAHQLAMWPMMEPALGFYVTCGLHVSPVTCGVMYQFEYSSPAGVDGSWTQHTVSSAPSPRFGMSTWVRDTGRIPTDRQLWMFGGYSTVKNSLLAYVDLKTSSWKTVANYVDNGLTNYSSHPGARSIMMMSQVPTCGSLIFLYGGVGFGSSGGEGNLGDLWVLNLDLVFADPNTGWTFVSGDEPVDTVLAATYTPPFARPGQRRHAGSTLVPSTGEFFVYSGAGASHADVWSFRWECPIYACPSRDGCNSEKGNGTCSAPDVCACSNHSVYTGVDCSEPVCFGETELTGACNGIHGNCTFPNTCSCVNHSLYTGETCSVAVCSGETDPVACNGTNGICVAPNVCECVNATMCSGHGTCNTTIMDEWSCDCEADWGGPHCDILRCEGGILNTENPCSGHGHCMNPPSTACTACDGGWGGKECKYFQCPGTVIVPDPAECPPPPYVPPCFVYKDSFAFTSVSGQGSVVEPLIILDTKSLIASGKLEDDCSSLRFRRRSNAEWMEYYQETPCNTSFTRFWFTLVWGGYPTETIDVYYKCVDKFGETMAVPPTYHGWNDLRDDVSPTDGFFMFSETDCSTHSGMVAVDASREGHYIRLNDAGVGTTRAAVPLDHSHSSVIDSATTPYLWGGCPRGMFDVCNFGCVIYGGPDVNALKRWPFHYHQITFSTLGAVESLDPPYTDLLMCRSRTDGAFGGIHSVGTGGIVLTDSDSARVPSKFVRHFRTADRFGRITTSLGSAGSEGGSPTHTHSPGSVHSNPNGVSVPFQWPSANMESATPYPESWNFPAIRPTHHHPVSSVMGPMTNLPDHVKMPHLVAVSDDMGYDSLSRDVLFLTNFLPPRGYELYSVPSGAFLQDANETETTTLLTTSRDGHPLSFVFGIPPVTDRLSLHGGNMHWVDMQWVDHHTYHDRENVPLPGTQHPSDTLPYLELRLVRIKGNPRLDGLTVTRSSLRCDWFCDGVFCSDPAVCSGNGSCRSDGVCAWCDDNCHDRGQCNRTNSCICDDPSSWTGALCETPVCAGGCPGGQSCVLPGTCAKIDCEDCSPLNATLAECQANLENALKQQQKSPLEGFATEMTVATSVLGAGLVVVVVALVVVVLVCILSRKKNRNVVIENKLIIDPPAEVEGGDKKEPDEDDNVADDGPSSDGSDPKDIQLQSMTFLSDEASVSLDADVVVEREDTSTEVGGSKTTSLRLSLRRGSQRKEISAGDIDRLIEKHAPDAAEIVVEVVEDDHAHETNSSSDDDFECLKEG